jgi:FkbM family methyltransferase
MNAVDPAPIAAETSDDLFLGGALTVRQPRRGYRAGTDAVLLAAMITPGMAEAGPVLDMGAGVGVVGLCVAARCRDARVVLLERDRDLVAIARDNVGRNGLSDRLSVIEADIMCASEPLQRTATPEESFAVVLANPPYHDDQRSTAAENRLKATSHQMPEEALDAWARFMCRMAAPGGRVAMIHKSEALPRILGVFAGRFGAIGVIPVYPRAGEPAIRVIVEGIKGSRAPAFVKPGFVMHGPGQEFTPEVEAIFRHGAPLPASIAFSRRG